MSSRRNTPPSSGNPNDTTNDSNKKHDNKESVNSLLTVNKNPTDYPAKILYTETGIIGIRIPILYIHIYKERVARDPAKMKALKEVVASAIMNLAKINFETASDEKKISVNMPLTINVQAKAEARPHIENNVNINIDEIVGEVRAMREILTEWLRGGIISKAGYERIARHLKNIENIRPTN